MENLEPIEKYGLDMHCSMILEEYRALKPMFEKMKDVVIRTLKESLRTNNIYVTALEARVKEEKSLAGKLELKGQKYMFLSDITDILGARVITFYSDEVDKISALVDTMFDVDWENSVDKRKIHDLDSFGYNSLHYICRIPKSLYQNPEFPELNEYRFELQMRTAMQHVWATMYHDTGYKSGVEIPREYIRNLNRLAGMLELADEQFSIIRTNINDYRRKVQALVGDGKFEEVPLNGDTFRSYLQMEPFDKLNHRIAAINQAEVHKSTAMPYLEVFKQLGFKTLADVDNLIRDYSETAYQFAAFQIGNTDVDIIDSTVAIQDLLIVYILKKGGGTLELKSMFDALNGPSDYNQGRAERLLAQAEKLNITKK